jgi:glycosyltransferase involved in cell wall biosynthesis
LKENLKIAVNTRFLLKDKLEGIGWFTFEVFKRIVQKHPEHEFIFLFDRPYLNDFVFGHNVKPVIVFPPARHYYLWYCWFELFVPLILKKEKVDLFVSPDGFLSLNTKIPTTLVIHDLAFEHRPHDVDKLSLKWYKKYTPRYVHKAKRIATVSEYSKLDMIHKYKVDANKIDVVYNGCHQSFEPISEHRKQETRKVYGGGKDYFIFVGAIQPRKNLINLFKAFDAFKAGDDKGIKLIIVGRKAWHIEETFHAYENMQFKDQVVFTGRVSTVELKNLLGSALALTYIPFFEGFGIPIIEAQSCGTPVITSTTTSMPEASGGGALLVEPTSIKEIVNAMNRIVSDEKLRQELIEKGGSNARRFSWDKTADKLWETMMKSVN